MRKNDLLRVVEESGVPERVEASAVGVEVVARRAVPLVQTVLDVLRRVRVDHIEEDVDAQRVRLVHEVFQVVGSAEAAEIWE